MVYADNFMPQWNSSADRAALKHGRREVLPGRFETNLRRERRQPSDAAYGPARNLYQNQTVLQFDNQMSQPSMVTLRGQRRASK
jgi:hypothetical protein